MARQTESPLEVQPLRNLTFWHIWALGVGTVVGDGIFLLLGQAIQTAGPSSVLSLFIAGVLQLFLMLCLVELAVGMPAAGAMEVWVKRFLGDWWGYLAGFSWAFAWVIVGGAISIALGRFLSYWIPVNELILAAAAMTVFAILNILGALVAASTQFWMTVGMVALMAGLAIFGAPKALAAIPENFIPFMPFGWKGMLLAIPMGAYAYMGTACLCTSGSECKDVRDLPRALVWASITFIILFTLDQVFALGAVNWKELTMAESPFVTAAEAVFGRVAASIINVAAVLAAATCLLMGTYYSSSRIFYQEAREGRMPAFLGYLHPRFRTPVWGIVVIWAVSIAIIVIARYNPDLVYVTFTMQFLVASFISYGLSIAAAILYRRRYPEEVAKLPYRMPVPWLTIPLAIGGTAVTAYFAFVGTPQTLPLALVWIVPLYVWYRYRVSRRSVGTQVST